MGNKCNIVRDILPLYVDDVVCSDTREFVDGHMKECPECAKVLETIRMKPVLPANCEERKRSAGGLKRFRRFWQNRRLMTALAVLAGTLLLAIGCIIFLFKTVSEIPYDGSNITIKETDGSYALFVCYHEPGYISYGAGTDVATGVTSLVITQSLWERYIEPLYDPSEGEYYLMESYMTQKIVDQTTGEVLWEADDEQQKAYEAWHEKFIKETGALGGG